MNEKILFHLDGLTIAESKLLFGSRTFSYADIAATKIDEARPYTWLSLLSLAALVPLVFMMVWGKITFGLFLPMTAFLISLLPAIGLVVFGFTHRSKCLFVRIKGRSVAVLKSNDVELLQRAQQTIQRATADGAVAHRA